MPAGNRLKFMTPNKPTAFHSCEYISFDVSSETIAATTLPKKSKTVTDTKDQEGILKE
jgi:hypothetical protein